MHPGNSPRTFSRPLIPVLLAFMGGIVAGLYLPGHAWVFWSIPVAVILSLVPARRIATSSILTIFTLLGYWSLQGWIAPKLPADHISHFIDEKPWHIIGTVRDLPLRLGDRTRFSLETESVTRGQLYHPTTGAIRITVRGDPADLRKGDRIGCFARLKGIRNFNNPGAFDYRRHLVFRGVWASAFVSKEGLLVRLHGAQSNGIGRALDRARAAVARLIDRAAASSPGAPGPGGVLKALIIGERQEIPPEIRENFNRIGVAHLLAISGLHIGMVATLAFFLFRACLSRSERILLAAWSCRGAALLTAIPVLFYGFLAGMSPATERAVIMVLAFLCATLLEREPDAINTLAVAAMVILVVSPQALFEISFQLSFAAVFVILYVLQNLSLVQRLKQRPGGGMLKRLALFLIVSAAAILGTLPVSLYYFNQTSLIGIVTNCVMVPLVGFLVVPLGLAAVFLLPAAPTGAVWMMKGALVLLEGGTDLAAVFSRIPFAAVNTVTPSLTEIGLYYLLLWVLFRLRETRWAKTVLVGAALMALLDVAYWGTQRFAPGDLKITVLDVGQGSSALLELPTGACMLIDGGGFYDNRFDVGARIVAPFLWQKKIATVETLVLSHPHPDHLNGLVFIADRFNVRELWLNREVVSTRPYNDLLDTAAEKGIKVLGPRELATPQIRGGVRFDLLYPPTDFLNRKRHEGWRTMNNNSLVLKATFKETSFLLAGDIEAEAERELSALMENALESHVLLVPHHGSKTSSTPAFLDRVNPSVAVISAGWGNRSGLPHESVLKRYETIGCRIFRTDRDGAVTLTTDGKQWKVTPHLSPNSPPKNRRMN